MGFFRRKNKPVVEEGTKTIEERNKIHEEYWAKQKAEQGDEEFMDIARKAQQLRSTNMSEEDVQNWIFNQLPEGRIKINDKRMWICRSCENARKFDTKEDYIAHQMSVHS